MANYNKVLLVGRLIKDPELRYSKNGQPIAKLGMAVNRRYTDKDDKLQEEVTFVDITSFGVSAESTSKFLKKGSPLMVDGRLHLNRWENDKGEKRSKLEVIAERTHFLPRNEPGQAPELNELQSDFESPLDA